MRRVLVLAALVLGAVAPAAAAHVQVTPAVVAPGDAAMFTVLVPNERDVPTTKVAVQIPEGVIPFAFEEAPGWERTEQQAANGALESVTWTGSLPEGSFVRFTFLASSPEAEGTLTFPAVQTYEDGQEAAWIGAPDSEEPAPTVEVTADAPSANAGGEGDEEADTGAAATDPATTTAAPATSESAPTTAPDESTVTAAADAPVSVTVDDDGGGTSTVAWIGLVLGAAGLVAGLAALAVATRRRGGPPGGDPTGPESF
jgi:uncharacterized protein YcnI